MQSLLQAGERERFGCFARLRISEGKLDLALPSRAHGLSDCGHQLGGGRGEQPCPLS